MLKKWLSFAALVAACAVASPTLAAPAIKMVAVDSNVTLEVLDWGGSGPPLIFLSGFGGTAHDFDGLAEKFIPSHHVYAITRRGFGASSHPEPAPSAYTPERLAADTMTVVAKLGIDRPFIAGHSVAGQELSEIGTQHASKVRGLVYLDATNAQAFYGPSSDVFYPIAGQVKRDLDRLIDAQPSEAQTIIDKINDELPRLQRGLAWYSNAVKGAHDFPPETANSPQFAVQHAIVEGARVYGPVSVPTLAIVALPSQCAPDCQSAAAQRRARADEVQIEDFAKANPSATVIKLPYADHFVWKTNEDAVVHSMEAFMQKASH